MYQVKIIADSISQQAIRLLTYEVRFPRMVHQELLTHRVFSRNASSSRAIPVKKLTSAIRVDPAMPVHWGKNQPGMQAKEECNELVRVPAYLRPALAQFFPEADGEFVTREIWWRFGANLSCDICDGFADAGYHKQIANRQAEHSQWISVVLSSTEWDNFFELRDHEDAQPEIRKLAHMMKEAADASTPTELVAGEWHLPYIEEVDRQAVHHMILEAEDAPLYDSDEYYDEFFGLLKNISAARCCRVSYLKHDGTKASIEEELALCDRLIGARPLHASPFEHQATPDELVFAGDEWLYPHLHGNFNGWIQFRKEVEEVAWNNS